MVLGVFIDAGAGKTFILPDADTGTPVGLIGRVNIMPRSDNISGNNTIAIMIKAIIILFRFLLESSATVVSDLNVSTAPGVSELY
jgi:hypothetical protein